MALADILPTLRQLSRAEKVRLIQLLAEELGGPEPTPHLEAGQSYPVGSPYDAYQAAEVLLGMLPKEKQRP